MATDAERRQTLAYLVGYGMGALRNIIRQVDHATPYGPRGDLAEIRAIAVDALRKLNEEA